MTINELLTEATRFASYAVREADRDRSDHERIMRYTAIAQACAQTAQAMILRQMAFDGVDGKLALYTVTP